MLVKSYNPEQMELSIYKMWEDAGLFKGNVSKDKEAFCIVMPPPNVTGQLHMGHALDITLQDIIVRYKRMRGYETLWIPGTDHAGIATQIKVEEELRVKEGKTRYDLGREKFLQRVWKWKQDYGNRIVEQQKKLGISCDWSKARFTMDEGLSRAVREAFCRLYEKGYIYKGNRIINWCPHCLTALSDTEVEYVNRDGYLWYIKYEIVDGSGDYLTVATTRPETLLGDTGVAVHPLDKRYAEFIGKKCILPLMNYKIPIIADEYVEKDFGTGVVKMTPAHDPNDFEIGLKHHLDTISCIGVNGKMNENSGKYAGMDRYECRNQIVKDLEEQGYIIKVEPYSHNVGTCYRCHNDVEQLISSQWFVKMESLAKEALKVVYSGDIKFIPERFSKIYINWMENVHDWCISRQLWWGHQIPAWECLECGHITVNRIDPNKCEKCGSSHIIREEDVLDTWFSSALWPFSILGWPDKTFELEYFYPTNLLITGYDIIFFWVSRMIFSACEYTKQVPFKTVLLHGLVLDDKGRKMSKSLGNGIDPLEMADKYGTDALRLNLITGNGPGNDCRFYREKCEAMQKFANKLWNASRFVIMSIESYDNPDKKIYELPDEIDLEYEDKWILSKLNKLIQEVTDNLEQYEIGIASSKVHDFIWDIYCDWYIELTKTRLNPGLSGSKSCETAQRVLCYVLIQLLKLLHPFMPFITEGIYQMIPHSEPDRFLMISSWPQYIININFECAERQIDDIIRTISAIRMKRSEMDIHPSKKSDLWIITSDSNIDAYKQSIRFIQRLAYAKKVCILTDCSSLEFNVNKQIAIELPDKTGGIGTTVYLPLEQLIDKQAERLRILKKLEKARNGLNISKAKLSNNNFLSHAPKSEIDKERIKVENYGGLISKLENSLLELGLSE